jgi:hypothetical protein
MSVEEKIGRNETPLNRIHGETELLQHREAQEDRIAGFAEYHPARDRVSVQRDCRVADVSLLPAPVGQDEGNLPTPVDSQTIQDLSRNHRQRRASIRERHDGLGPRARSRVDRDDLDPHLTHGVTAYHGG